MALWGNKDTKTASGTIAIAGTGVVTGSSTSFTTQAKVGNYITVAGVDYQIVSITSNTVAKVESGINGGAIAVVNAGASYTLSEKPAFVAASESSGSPSGVHGNSNKVYGVDPVEQTAKTTTVGGPQHAGWVRRTVGTGGRAGRVFYETLVAAGSVIADAADDVVFPDGVITITAQTGNRSVTAPAATTFSVTASAVPTASLTYLWQADNGTGYGFRDFTVDNEPQFTGWNTATLTIDPTATELTGWKVRCVVSAVGMTSVTSAESTLTVA